MHVNAHENVDFEKIVLPDNVNRLTNTNWCTCESCEIATLCNNKKCRCCGEIEFCRTRSPDPCINRTDNNISPFKRVTLVKKNQNFPDRLLTTQLYPCKINRERNLKSNKFSQKFKLNCYEI